MNIMISFPSSKLNHSALPDTAKIVKKQAKYWEKVLANQVPKGLYTEYIKNSQESIIKSQVTQ